MEIIATADSMKQAEQLLRAGVDRLYIGNSQFGLRLPYSFSVEELREIVHLAHQEGKKVTVAVNSLMHNEHMEELPEFLEHLADMKVDAVACGDPGAIMLLSEMAQPIPFIYDAQTFVTSAEQISFWEKQGAIGAVLARELTEGEIKAIASSLTIPVEVLVYGPTCIHQSKRKLVTNYHRIVELEDDTSKERGLYLREPNDETSQLPIYEDESGTHIFASEDVSLVPYLADLYDAGLKTWKLDGVLAESENFVQIASLLVEAKEAVLRGQFVAEYFVNKLTELQPPTRKLDAGFYLKNPDDVK
ncbi:U32 family peptidase [Listeria monocytogenes]|nr:U32 family peptidase [Listeria monocytogenes]EAD7227790.1 U32 family peptidase [Listeria monocytogenes]EAF6357623.1 U32 family peptidase [Listeria monocytogenes]EEO3714458.1 U32 family peptidase [Listeria monocytogenes]EGL5067927.1 U32 family peptidase [Listeria monocytogenes]